MAVKLLKRIRRWFGVQFQKRKLDADMDEEMRAHVEMRTRENLAAGMGPREAHYAALRQFGWVESIKESCREERGSFVARHLTVVSQDLRFACRQLLKNPGFTSVTVLSLTLGIAANTTIFSFVNALLFRPPPVEKPGELWQIYRWEPQAGSKLKRHKSWSRPEIAQLREQNQSFAAFGAFDPEPALLTCDRDGLGESVQGQFVTGNFFDLCGVRPAWGRAFLPTEDQTPGTHPVTVVSYAFWRSRLGADPQAVGRTVTLNGVALTVIGVAPSPFTSLVAGVAPDFWVPFMMVPAVLRDPGWLTRQDSASATGLGRLKPGVSAARAGAELTVLTRRFQGTNPRGDASRNVEAGAVLTPSTMVPEPLRGLVGAFTGTLMGAVFLVLLIACANAANLLLARATARRQELAVRSALGASRGRLLRQLLTESVLLALFGGVMGLILSVWLAQLIGRLIPSNLPVRFATSLDWRVLSFTAGVSVLTGVIFGLAPALRGARLNPAAALKEDTRGSSRRSRLAHALIAGQMALCLVLLLAGTLCLRSLFHARSLNPGFEVRDRVAASYNLGDVGYTAAQAREFHDRLLARVQTLPGVRSAALTQCLPLGTEHNGAEVRLEGQAPAPEPSGIAFQSFSVSPGYFATLGTALLRGREFTAADRDGAPRVAIINEAAASRCWPGQNPLGRRFFVGDTQARNAREIVGVVPTGRYRTLGEDPKPALFECFQPSSGASTLVARVQGDPQPVLAAIRRSARELEPRLALTEATTLEQHLSLALFPVRASGLLLGVLGLVALVLAASGLFGVIAYSVAQRTREVGIRLALGAQRRDVRRLVLRQGIKLAGLGIAVGLAGAVAVTRLLRAWLFGVSPLDPASFLAIPLLLLGVAWLACWLPARRAARVDPIVALRAE